MPSDDPTSADTLPAVPDVTAIEHCCRSGRPTKLTPDVAEAFCGLAESGIPLDTACDYLGISRSSFFDWVRKGAEYFENGSPASFEKYGVFYSGLRRASAGYVIKCVKRFHDPSNRDYYREIVMLERRHRGAFSRFDSGGDTRDFNPDEKFL